MRFTSLATRLCGFSLAGPKARTLLSRLTRADLSNEGLPYLHAVKCELGPVPEVIVLRVSYTGELGYEIYFPAEYQIALYGAPARGGRGPGPAARGRSGPRARCASRRGSRAGAGSSLPTTTPTRRAWDAS